MFIYSLLVIGIFLGVACGLIGVSKLIECSVTGNPNTGKTGNLFLLAGIIMLLFIGAVSLFSFFP